MAYTESFKKKGVVDISASDIVSMYRTIYNNRLNRNWPVPGGGYISASSEEGKIFGSRNRANEWGTPSEVISSKEAKARAFQYLYQLCHYGEGNGVTQHAGYAKTFPAFNAGNELASGHEIFSSYYNELERYKNDISSSRGNIGCSNLCVGDCTTSCSESCYSGCTDGNCENGCESGGTDSCSSANCGKQCSSYCTSRSSDGCSSGCTASCSNSCTGRCTGGCTNSVMCETCTATCQTACLGSSSSIVDYKYGCESSSQGASIGSGEVSGCDSGCGKTSTMGETQIDSCNHNCGGTATKGTACLLGCGKTANS